MDQIIIKNLKLHGYHGVYSGEKEEGQPFLVYLKLGCDLDQAKDSDNVQDTVDYAKVIEKIKTVFNSDRYNLIEALADDIASSILSDFSKVSTAKIKIKKPEAADSLKYAAVEVNKGINS